MRVCYVVPGRVELVGKHVDYGGGRSLTCAVHLALKATARQIDGPVLRVVQRGRRDAVEMPLTSNARPARAQWSTYAAAVARRLSRDFPGRTRGVAVELASDLPPSAGLSSSAALTVALTWAVADANDLAQGPGWRAHVPSTLAFAEYAAAVETGTAFGPFHGDEGVGVRGGAEDHIAILCSREGMLGRFSYVPAREEGWVPWPRDYAIAIGVSGVRASKTDNARAAYNRASDTLSWLVSAWNAHTGRSDATLAAAYASGSGAARELAAIVERADGAPVPAAYLAARLAQFREECVEIVPGVADAFRRGDLSRVGALVDRSQELAERALENQVPETVFLARAARERGAVAASAFGAGFGGAVWAMVLADGAERWLTGWKRAYMRRFPRRAARAQFFVTRPSAPARREPGE